MGLVANVPMPWRQAWAECLFVFTVVFAWLYLAEALAMVFICGLINIIITVTKIRKMIIQSIPSLQSHRRRYRHFIAYRH